MYQDDLNITAYVVDKVFGLGTYKIDRVMVLNMWWIGLLA